MYALVIPPELVRRLYRLREQHARGPIRRQILTAVERYLEDVEQELACPPMPESVPTAVPEPTVDPVSIGRQKLARSRRT